MYIKVVYEDSDFEDLSRREVQSLIWAHEVPAITETNCKKHARKLKIPASNAVEKVTVGVKEENSNEIPKVSCIFLLLRYYGILLLFLFAVIYVGSTTLSSSSSIEPTVEHLDYEYSKSQGFSAFDIATEICYTDVMSISRYEGPKAPANYILGRSNNCERCHCIIIIIITWTSRE